jgi:endo-1,4-beta-xylanase
MIRRLRHVRIVIFILLIISSNIFFVSCGNVVETKNDTTILNEEKNEVNKNETSDLDEVVDKNIENHNEDDSDMEAKENREYYQVYKESGELPNLSEVYIDDFKIGVALSQGDLNNESKKLLVASQFNSITCENEMKADFKLDRNATLALGDEEYPVVNMKNAETALKFAKDNGIQMRGHTLVWHSQTPRWLFTVGFDDSPDAPYVTREVMLARMENYIRQEIEYINKNYPGIIYAWDVVNEAIEINDGHEKGYRTSNNLWYEVLGEDFIELAFTYARKYVTPEQKLYYNDYGTYEKSKMFAIYNMAQELKEKDLIDGIGMQDHIQIDYPALLDYQYAIKKYAELGLEIQITELDIDVKDNSEEMQEKLATRYKTIISVLKNFNDKKTANITSITFWGLTDDRSWLNKVEEPSYPLLFDKNLEPKSAYFGVLQDKMVKSY